MGIGIYIGNTVGNSKRLYWTPQNKSDLWYKDRSGGEVSETLKDNTGYLVPSVGAFNGTDNAVNFPAIAGYDFTGDFYIYAPHFKTGTLAADTVISKESNPTGAEFRVDIAANGSIALWVFEGGSVSNYRKFITGSSVIAPNTVYSDLLISYNATSHAAFIGINGLTKTHTDTTSGSLSSVTQGSSPLMIGGIGRATPTQYFAGQLGLVQCGKQYVTSVAAITTNFFKVPLCGNTVYEFDVTSGGTGTWIGNAAHIAYHTNGSRFAFDNGYKLYEKAGQSDQQVATGGVVTAIVAAGYSLKSIVAGSSQYVNKAKGCLNFNYLNLTAGGYYNVVFDGDSLTLGSKSTAGNSYPEQLAAKFLADDGIKINVTNLGVGSQTLADMESDAATQVDVLQGAYKRILVGWGGINDLALAPQQTKEATWARVLAYYTNRKAAGWDYVFACTITPQTAYARADYETARAWVNNKIRTELNSVVDGIIDFAGDSRIGDTGDELDTTYYDVDKIHFNDTGYGVVAGLVYTGIKAAIVANKHAGLATIDMFNKNDSTIHIATGGMDYVDATNYYLWRLDELSSYAKYNSYKNTDYQDRQFTKIEDDLIKEIIVCTDKQTGGKLTLAKKYCGII